MNRAAIEKLKNEYSDLPPDCLTVYSRAYRQGFEDAKDRVLAVLDGEASDDGAVTALLHRFRLALVELRDVHYYLAALTPAPTAK